MVVQHSPWGDNGRIYLIMVPGTRTIEWELGGVWGNLHIQNQNWNSISGRSVTKQDKEVPASKFLQDMGSGLSGNGCGRAGWSGSSLYFWLVALTRIQAGLLYLAPFLVFLRLVIPDRNYVLFIGGLVIASACLKPQGFSAIGLSELWSQTQVETGPCRPQINLENHRVTIYAAF